MIKKQSRNEARKKRQLRKRQFVLGTATIPRLSVFRSHQSISAQLIDDENGVTLASVNAQAKALKLKRPGNIEAAAVVGREIAKKALALKIKQVKFDRGGYLYHGRVQALADAARENGLEF